MYICICIYIFIYIYIIFTIYTYIYIYNYIYIYILNIKLLICEFHDSSRLINKRSELVSKCRHQNKYILRNFKPNG